MAAAEQRKLLQQLMGGGPEDSSSGPQLSITDPKVCRSYICGTCPHDLFVNTKTNLGPCDRIHSDALKTKYELASQSEKLEWNLEPEYLAHLRHHIRRCDQQIESLSRRLEKTPEEIKLTNALLKSIGELNQTNEAGIQELKIMANIAAVNLAYQDHFKMRQALVVKQEKDKELKILNDTGGSSGHQKLQVCDICGAYLSRLDNDRRLADHFYGKMHLGFSQMRKTADKLSIELGDRGRSARHHTFREPGNPNVDYGGGGGYRGGGYRGGRGGRGGGRGGRGRGYYNSGF